MNNKFKAQSLNRKSYRKSTSSCFSVTCFKHVGLLWPISAVDRKQVRGYTTCGMPVSRMYMFLKNGVKGFLTHWVRENLADISQTTFSNTFSWMQNIRISSKISLRFVPKGPNNIIPALIQRMAWCRQDDKPLSEPVVSLLTHICVTRPHWVH